MRKLLRDVASGRLRLRSRAEEDFYWSMLAAAGEKTGYLGPEETAKRLKKYAERARMVMDGVRHNKTNR